MKIGAGSDLAAIGAMKGSRSGLRPQFVSGLLQDV